MGICGTLMLPTHLRISQEVLSSQALNFEILTQAVIGNIVPLYLWLFSFLSKQTRIINTISVTVLFHVLQYSDICITMGHCDRVQQLLLGMLICMAEVLQIYIHVNPHGIVMADFENVMI